MLPSHMVKIQGDFQRIRCGWIGHHLHGRAARDDTLLRLHANPLDVGGQPILIGSCWSAGDALFEKRGVSICSGFKDQSSSSRGMWSKAPVESTKVLNKRIGLSFKMHLLLTWILILAYLWQITPDRNDLSLVFRSETIHQNLPMDKSLHRWWQRCSSTAMVPRFTVHPFSCSPIPSRKRSEWHVVIAEYKL